MDRAPDFDVAIVGAGPAGLSLARSLAPLPLKIAVIEQLDSGRLADPPFDGREIALTQRSVDILQRLGIWAHIDAQEIAPLNRAQARNGRTALTLHFDLLASGLAQQGQLVPNHLIRRAAWRSIEAAGGVEMLAGTTVQSTRHNGREVSVMLSNGAAITTRLVVAADSRFSTLRRAAGIPAQQHDYGKTMLVCRMAHERPHQGLARSDSDQNPTQ